MQQFDWLIGGAAIAVGLTIAVSAMANASWLMELPRPKWLVEKLGPLRARAALVAAGLVFVALGAVILSGWRPPWSIPQQRLGRRIRIDVLRPDGVHPA